MRSTFFAFVLLWSVPLFAQTGNYFLSHYAPDIEQSSNVCFGMTQDDHGILYFATKSGILQFDGRNWNLINETGPVYTISNSPSGEIYWGGSNGYGRIRYDNNGFQTSELLSEKVSDVFESAFVQDHQYFLNETTIFSYNVKLQKTSIIKTAASVGSFLGLFELFGRVYVSTQNDGLFTLDNDKLTKSKISIPGNADVVFTSPLENNYLIGTADNRIYFCSANLQLHEVTLEDQKYVNASVVVSGRWINKQLVALGTLRGGVIFFNPITGKTDQIINYNTGLPDNEVFALMCDNHQNIWIAHDYGFTRVAPYLPLRSFSHYPDIQGNLLCAISFENRVYVGTSLGLFTLEKEELYDEIVYYEDVLVEDRRDPKKEKSIPKKTVEEPVTEEIKQPQVQTESKKKGFFSFLKKNKSKDQPQQTRAATQPQEKDEEPTKSFSLFKKKPVYKREKRVQRILRASQFVYKRVQGIDAKVTQLLDVNGKLVAAGLGGAYEIASLQAKPILESPVRFIFANKRILLAATYSNEVKSWAVEGWKSLSLLDTLNDEVDYIFQGANDEIWLCAFNKIYRMQIAGASTSNLEALAIPSKDVDESVGVQWHDETVVANAGGFFYFNRVDRKFEKIDSLPKPRAYFAGTKNLWYHDQHSWKSFGTRQEQSNLQLLNLFQDLRFITPDKTNNLWLITGNNELFKFFGDRITPYNSTYPILIKSIQLADKRIGGHNTIKIDQEEGSLSIEVIQPSYIGAESTEYRYALKGVSDVWSSWGSSNSTLDFAYLPPGSYKLRVQSRDIFGKVTDMEPLAFQVRPPYWQRPWFYALEVFIFGSLVLLSFRLSTKYIIVSRLLSLITIILLMQFIQTAATVTLFKKTSPVVDFLVQVLVALMVLPVEGYLRRLMFRSIESGQGLRGLIKKSSKKEEN